MAEIIPYQPVILDEELSCHLYDSEVQMLAEHGDITQVQLRLEPCPSDFELIQNSEFNGSTHWSTTGGGWVIGGGSAIHTVGISGSFYQAAPTPDGQLVRLTFDLINSSSTTPVVLTWGNYSNHLFTGSYELWITADSANNLMFSAGGGVGAQVTNLQMISINTNFNIAILDDNGTPVDTINTSDGYFNFNDGYFTASIDWEDLGISDGCYQLAVIDPCPCAQRGITALDLETSTFEWQISSGWTISGGTATFNDNALGTATLYSVICSGKIYKVSYTLAGMSANEEFYVSLGSNDGTTRTTDGTFTDTITSNGTLFRLNGNPTGAQTFTVTDIEIEEVFPSTTYLSNFIKVQESFSCKTLLIYMCNDTNAFGFGFEGTGFRPMYRIEGSLARGSYPSTRESYQYSNGRKATTYGRMRVARELGLDLPPHLVDFMSISPLIDHFYVGTTEYFIEEDEFPTVSWDENVHLGGFTLTISEKTQLLENRRLTSASVGCTFEGEGLDNEGASGITDELAGEILLDGG